MSNIRKFAGKKLLILGSNVGSSDIVKYAKKEGAYTIVADYLPPEKSAAKLIADEHWLISTTDIDTLYTKCIENKINGVFAGISELNLLNSMVLSEKLGLRFYCNRKQWNLVENKACFRKLCQKYSVPCPKTYHIGGLLTQEQYSSIKYPVILKPIDGSSSIGVVICRNESDLKNSIYDSISKSSSGQIIIEEYFEGDEFAAHYTISEGRVCLSCIDNRYPVSVNEGIVTTIPVARLYPSRHINSFLHSVNNELLSMIESLNLNTGVLFVQGLYNTNSNKFVIFEAGLRSAGESPCRFIEYLTGNNYINNIIDYILLGHGSLYLANEDPLFKGKHCALISFVTKGGIIGRIEGIEEIVSKYKNIIDYECRYYVGDLTPSGNTLRQIMIRFAIVSSSITDLKETIRNINNTVKVSDIEGRNMCLVFDENNIQ